MTRKEMDNLNMGDKVEVRKYSVIKEDYEWIPTIVSTIHESVNGEKFAHGGYHSVYAKVNGFTECLTPELTRLVQ